MKQVNKKTSEIATIGGIRVPYHHSIRRDQCVVQLVDNVIRITEREGKGDWKIEINLNNNQLSFHQEATDSLEQTVLLDSIAEKEDNVIRYDFVAKEDHPFHPERAAFWLQLIFNVDTETKQNKNKNKK